MGSELLKQPAKVRVLRLVGVAVGAETRTVFVVSPARADGIRSEVPARAKVKALDSIVAVKVVMDDIAEDGTTEDKKVQSL